MILKDYFPSTIWIFVLGYDTELMETHFAVLDTTQTLPFYQDFMYMWLYVTGTIALQTLSILLDFALLCSIDRASVMVLYLCLVLAAPFECDKNLKYMLSVPL